jgi:hypothetical protein
MGAPPELLNQLEQLDPADAIKKMRALKELTPREMQAYFNVLKAQQNLIHQQTMKQLEQQLQDYRKYGRQIGLQMAAGIRQESPAIDKAIKEAIRKSFGGAGGGGTGRGRGGGGVTKNNSDNTTITVHMTHTGASSKAQIEQALWAAYQRHRHKH